MFKNLSSLSEINNKLCNDDPLNIMCNNLIKHFFSKNTIQYNNLDEINNLKIDKKNKGFVILLNHTCIGSDFALILAQIDCFTVSTKELLNNLLFFSKLTNGQLNERCKLIEYQKKTDKTESNGEEVKNNILDKNNQSNIVQL